MKKIIITIFLLNIILIASNNATTITKKDLTQIKVVDTKINLYKATLENWKDKYKILSLKNENLLEKIENGQKQLNFLKWLYGIILFIFGFFGIKEYKSLIKLHKDVARDKEEYIELKNDVVRHKEKIDKLLKRAISYNKAVSLFNSGKIESAILKLKNIRKEHPNDYESTYFLSRCYVGLERYDTALKIANEALSLPIDSKEKYHAYNQIASAYLGNGDYESALKIYKKHLDSIQIAEIKNSHAYCYFRAKKNKEAYLTFEKAMEIRINTSSYLGMAKTKLIHGKFDISCTLAEMTIKYGNKELKKGLDTIWTYYNLAFAYLILNNEEKTLKYINIANNRTSNKSQIGGQILDYELMLNNNNVNQELLNKCLKLWKCTYNNEKI